MGRVHLPPSNAESESKRRKEFSARVPPWQGWRTAPSLPAFSGLNEYSRRKVRTAHVAPLYAAPDGAARHSNQEWRYALMFAPTLYLFMLDP